MYLGTKLNVHAHNIYIYMSDGKYIFGLLHLECSQTYLIRPKTMMSILGQYHSSSCQYIQSILPNRKWTRDTWFATFTKQTNIVRHFNNKSAIYAKGNKLNNKNQAKYDFSHGISRRSPTAWLKHNIYMFFNAHRSQGVIRAVLTKWAKAHMPVKCIHLTFFG